MKYKKGDYVQVEVEGFKKEIITLKIMESNYSSSHRYRSKFYGHAFNNEDIIRLSDKFEILRYEIKS